MIFLYRYGTEVGTVTENALTAAGNTYLTVYNTAALAPKTLAKRAVKTTGKVAVGVSEEIILGQQQRPRQITDDHGSNEAKGESGNQVKPVEYKKDDT